MPSPFVYRLINGYINGSTIKVGQGRKAFFGFTATIDTEPFLFYGFAPTIDTEPFLFYGFTTTIDTATFLFTVLPRFLTESHRKKAPAYASAVIWSG